MEDRLLVWRFKHGSSEALTRIYEKYGRDMHALAGAFLHDRTEAEDAVHDVFVKFARSGQGLKLAGNLKSFLMTCVANRCRDIVRQRAVYAETLKIRCEADSAERFKPASENESEINELLAALETLPYEQQEIILLHGRSGLTFKAIALNLGISINTAQSRYRYGLEKLRSILKDEVRE